MTGDPYAWIGEPQPRTVTVSYAPYSWQTPAAWAWLDRMNAFLADREPWFDPSENADMAAAYGELGAFGECAIQVNVAGVRNIGWELRRSR